MRVRPYAGQGFAGGCCGGSEAKSWGLGQVCCSLSKLPFYLAPMTMLRFQCFKMIRTRTRDHLETLSALMLWYWSGQEKCSRPGEPCRNVKSRSDEHPHRRIRTRARAAKCQETRRTGPPHHSPSYCVNFSTPITHTRFRNISRAGPHPPQLTFCLDGPKRTAYRDSW